MKLRGISFSISSVNIGWKCVQIFCILEHFEHFGNKCKSSSVSSQWTQLGLLSFEHFCV